MKILRYYKSWLFLALLALAACKDDPFVENPSGETFIYNLQITNGDLSGGGRYNGTVDEAAKTVTFNNVAAESDVANVKLSGKISLGAHLDAEAYNFLEGNDPDATTLTKTITVTNVENVANYTVTIHLAAPQSAPVLSKMEIITAAGTVVAAVIDLEDNAIYLNTPNEDEVTVSSLLTVPKRAEYTFSNLTNNKLSKSNPGTLRLDFLGLSVEYTLSFERAPAAGINFSAPVVHDFSVNATLYPDFAAEMTRSADFDGEHVLIVYRDAPKLFRVSDLLANNVANPILLKTDHTVPQAGVETFAISSGQLSHGHVYLCNLAQAGQKLRVYYYDAPDSEPQLVLDHDNTITRFGDNLSVNLDENGNGYVYFIRQDPGDKILRFDVTNFTTFSNPFEINPTVNFSYYANYNRVGNSGSYIVSSTTTSMLQLLDKDGAQLYEVEMVVNEGGVDALAGTDVHIAEYNKGRYLLMTSGKRYAYKPASTLFIYDITEGFDLVSSLVTFRENHPEPVYTFVMDAALSTAPSANTAWAVVDNKLVVFTAAPHAGFALIEFPINRQ
ncbi:MAG: DUF4623 domain-containing protein [Dysgonamonadaceae bacterium]|nr:DUF4623 domain-containing protein [Dysgonamonadaceae bacterium]